MASAEEDYYALLGVGPTASEADIKKAYKKKALKWHPDKAKPEQKDSAEAMFHLLTVASDILLDPTARATYDAAHKARHAQKARMEKMDSHRRKQREDLEQREEAVKRRKAEATAEVLARQTTIDRLKEEGMRKLRAEEERRRVATMVASEKAREERERSEAASGGESIVDCSIKVKWKRKKKDYGVKDLEMFFSQYGGFAQVIPSTKGKATAVVVFTTVFSADAAMKDLASNHKSQFQSSWAGGKEPDALKPPSSNDTQTPIPPQSTPVPPTAPRPSQPAPPSYTTAHPPSSSSTFPSFPAFPTFSAGGFSPFPSTTTPVADDDYETITLMKMREAEREKLKAQIIAQEAEEARKKG
ncbi:DnaJ (Hsp40), sub C, member 17 [Borealophlyctis nickersoniae]|nr:DnaJ (Hsp40), sub C, member 17 [Borealophlyctis nickersoniae]